MTAGGAVPVAALKTKQKKIAPGNSVYLYVQKENTRADKQKQSLDANII